MSLNTSGLESDDPLFQVQHTADLLQTLGEDFSPEEDPDNPAWLELASMGSGAVDAILGAAWSDDSLLITAINMLGWRRERIAVLPLADMLEKLEKPETDDVLDWCFVASAIIDALAQIGDIRAVEALDSFLASQLGIKVGTIQARTINNEIVGIMKHGINPENRSIIFYSLADAYEELDCSNSLFQLMILLVVNEEPLRQNILFILKANNYRESLPVLDLLAGTGNERIKNLLLEWKQETAPGGGV